MRVIIKNTKDLGTIRGLFSFLVFLVDAFHAHTDQNHDQQQNGIEKTDIVLRAHNDGVKYKLFLLKTLLKMFKVSVL